MDRVHVRTLRANRRTRKTHFLGGWDLLYLSTINQSDSPAFLHKNITCVQMYEGQVRTIPSMRVSVHIGYLGGYLRE